MKTTRFAVMAYLLAGTSAYAQLAEAVPADEGHLQDIVVTAQRRSENVNNVPLSITTLTGAGLADRGVRSTEDLSSAVPGLSFSNSGFNSPVYTLRGIGYNDGSLLAGPTVAIYIDEVPLPYSAMTRGALLDVQRVEVLKGPQGTLYGTNSTGGAINYIAAAPTSETVAGVSAEYGRFSTFVGDGYLGGALADGVNARLSLSTTQSGDWQYSHSRDDSRGAIRKVLGRLLADWAISDSAKLTLGANGWRDKSDTQAPQAIARLILTPPSTTPELLAAPLSPRESRVADWTPGRRFRNDDGFYQFSAKLNWEVAPDWNLTSVSAYSRYAADTTQDRDGVNIEDQEYRIVGWVSSLYQELRLAYDNDGLRLLAGANYRHDKGHDRNVVYATYLTTLRQSAAVSIDGVDNDVRQKIDAFGLFTNADIPLADTVSLTGGLRYSKQKTDFAGCTRDTGSGQFAARLRATATALKTRAGLTPHPELFVPGGCISLNAQFDPILVRETLDEDNVSIKAGINWRPAPRTLIYASFNRGFKGGGFPNPAASIAAQYTPVTQERVDAYEAGFKLSAFDRMVQLNGAIFHYGYKDKQLYSRLIDPLFGPIRGLVNVPKSRVNGAELQIDFAPSEFVSLYAAGTYVDTKVLKGEFFNQSNIRESLIGRPFNFAPKWQLNSGFTVKHPVGSGLVASLSSDVTYRSKTTADFGSGPLFAVKAYALLNARLSISGDDERWTASIWGRNLTNSYYWNQVIPGGDFITRYTGMPITYGVALRFKIL